MKDPQFRFARFAGKVEGILSALDKGYTSVEHPDAAMLALAEIRAAVQELHRADQQYEDQRQEIVRQLSESLKQHTTTVQLGHVSVDIPLNPEEQS